jgi:endonuclease-3
MNSSVIEKNDDKIKRIYKIFDKLKLEHPDSRVLLDFKTPFQLLIATILAAQCTDDRVNSVTPHLFKQYPDPEKMKLADISELEKIVRSTGFYKNKAKSLKKVSEALERDYSGKLPETVALLATLPGVGRKTANVVAGNCFNVPSIIVDTHVKRVTGRLNLSNNRDPDKIEKDLCELISEKDRTPFSYAVNFHGRYICKARKPLCPNCVVKKLCPFPDKT